MARKGSVDTVSNVIDKLLSKLQKKQLTSNGKIFSEWETIVGQEIAEHVKPEKISLKKLYLTVDSSVWKFEITRRRRTDMLKSIRLVAGEEVEDIVVRVSD